MENGTMKTQVTQCSNHKPWNPGGFFDKQAPQMNSICSTPISKYQQPCSPTSSLAKDKQNFDSLSPSLVHQQKITAFCMSLLLTILSINYHCPHRSKSAHFGKNISVTFSMTIWKLAECWPKRGPREAWTTLWAWELLWSNMITKQKERVISSKKFQ